MTRLVEMLLPSYVVDIFEGNESRYELCNENSFKIPKFQSLRHGKHSLKYQSPYLSSKLYCADKYSDDLNPFIRNIR